MERRKKLQWKKGRKEKYEVKEKKININKIKKKKGEAEERT
jgi:hypothetical protein